MEKFDYSKDIKELYKPSFKSVQTLQVPKFNFLKIVNNQRGCIMKFI